MSVTNWVAGKIVEDGKFAIVGRTAEDFLIVKSDRDYTFVVAVLGVKNVISLSDVEPLFAGSNKPQFVVNVPSGTLWIGAAIDRIHAESAAFGTLGHIARAAATEDVGSYRNKDMRFFIEGMAQHTNVSNVAYAYDKVFKVDRRVGSSLVVAVIDPYNMSAEDVRNAKSRFGHFDVIIKSSNYGSITSQAEAAAKSMGAQALSWRDLLIRLAN